MTAYAMNDASSIEAMMAFNGTATERLRSAFGFESPRGHSQSAMSSDCCSSNNEPTQQG